VWLPGARFNPAGTGSGRRVRPRWGWLAVFNIWINSLCLSPRPRHRERTALTPWRYEPKPALRVLTQGPVRYP